MRRTSELEVVCAWPAEAELGEGPTWIAGEQALYWLDIKRAEIHRFHPESGQRRSWPSSRVVSCLIPRRAGGFVVGTPDGFGVLDLDSGEFDPIVYPEPDRVNNRMNDGKCDPMGRIWAGSMDDGESEPTGALYRLDSDGGVTRVDDGYVITNGPAFSPDGGTLYHTDTLARMIYAFDLADTGEIARKREFVRIPEDAGYPDGMTTDVEGGVWVAHFGGSRVTRFFPDGRVDRVVLLPCSNVTSCAFGGADLDVLWITTARKGLTEEELASQPLAGGLFRVVGDVPGMLPGEFGG